MYVWTHVGADAHSTFHPEPIPIKYSSEEDFHLHILHYSSLGVCRLAYRI